MNHILLAMSPDHRAELSHHLEPVELKSGQEIESADRLIPSLYFVETGIAAVVTIGERARVALGLIGCEGVSGLGLWLGDTQSAYSTVMLTDGTALRITASALRGAMESLPEFRRLLLRYALAFTNQAAHTALSVASSRVEQRVARFVLMAHDRTEGSEIKITHEIIAQVLGIRRAGVTSALALLRDSELIELRRGSVIVLNRKGIERVAGSSYGRPEKEFVRLIGTFWPPVRRRRKNSN